MTDQEANESPPQTPADEPQALNQHELKLQAARDQAAKERIRYKEARDTGKAHEARANELEAKLSTIQEATGVTPNSTPEPVTTDRSANQRAEQLVAKAAFKAEALKNGIDPALVDAATATADLSSVVVDLDAGTTAGVGDAVSAFAVSDPRFFEINQTTTNVIAGTATGPAGQPRGHRFDPAKATREEIQQFKSDHPEDWDAYRKSNPMVSMPGPNGRRISARVTHMAGGEFMQRVHRAKKSEAG